MQRSVSRQRGIAAVEFGLVMPIVLVMLFAVFEFGMAFWRKQVLTAAVRQGARTGVVATNPRKSEQDIIDAVEGYLDDVGYTNPGRTVLVDGEGGDAGDPLTVTATYPTSFLILSRLPLGSAIDSKVDGSGNMTLTAAITMQME